MVAHTEMNRHSPSHQIVAVAAVTSVTTRLLTAEFAVRLPEYNCVNSWCYFEHCKETQTILQTKDLVANSRTHVIDKIIAWLQRGGKYKSNQHWVLSER